MEVARPLFYKMTDKTKQKGKNMNQNQTQQTKSLAVIDGETLMEQRLEPTGFCVETLLPQGLCILAGAPKLGKSWLVLDLCLHIAKGEPVWNLPTKQGTTLYLCLEDSPRRIQERLNFLTDEVPSNTYFAMESKTMQDGLEEQITGFCHDHPDTCLVVIDTFQLIRGQDTDSSYAADYAEIQKIKRLADSLGICILLVHHLRKMGDSDPLNKISGSTGISGGVDAAYILDANRKQEGTATLVCTGRDIPYRELHLRMNSETHQWELLSDSLEQPETRMPEVLQTLIGYIKTVGSFHGSNTEFTEGFCSFCHVEISAKVLKRLMNQWRYQLEEAGVIFENRRSDGKRIFDIRCRAESDDRDDILMVPENVVPVDTVDPVS